jgi:hypothetical protein
MTTKQQRLLIDAIKCAWFALYGKPVRIMFGPDGCLFYGPPEITPAHPVSTDEAFEMLARMTEALAINRETQEAL